MAEIILLTLLLTIH